eukprot:scaffold130974_cov45-Attheya_sp.AAC.2
MRRLIGQPTSVRTFPFRRDNRLSMVRSFFDVDTARSVSPGWHMTRRTPSICSTLKHGWTSLSRLAYSNQSVEQGCSVVGNSGQIEGG